MIRYQIILVGHKLCCDQNIPTYLKIFDNIKVVSFFFLIVNTTTSVLFKKYQLYLLEILIFVVVTKLISVNLLIIRDNWICFACLSFFLFENASFSPFNLRCYWGYCFESLATEDPARSDGEGIHHVDANVEYCAVVKTKLGAHRILMGAEMDCCDSTDDGRRFYVELKTSREVCLPIGFSSVFPFFSDF